MNKKTKMNKLYNTMVVKGRGLTAKQIASRFGFVNPHDAIYRLRNEEGLAVKSTKTANGTKKYYV